MNIQELQPIPPNSNPYNFDLYNMGQSAGKDDQYEIMWGIDNNLIIVHKPTGKRLRVIPD
jgi:hypothetical protein